VVSGSKIRYVYMYEYMYITRESNKEFTMLFVHCSNHFNQVRNIMPR